MKGTKKKWTEVERLEEEFQEEAGAAYEQHHWEALGGGMLKT